MNERQRRFADEYIRLGNAHQAALNAGYSEAYAKTNSHKMLENKRIETYISKRLEKLRKQSIAEQEEILQFLTGVIRGEVQGKDKLGVGQGAERIIDREPTLQERIRAAEQLGKRYGMWTDRHEVEHKLPTFIDDVPDKDE